MATVFQCHKCSSIVGDTDIPVMATLDTIEVRFPTGIEISRGRVKCESCKDVLGVEDPDHKIFFNLKFVRRYVVQSVSDLSGGSKKKRRTEDDEGVVSAAQFQEFKDSMYHELTGIKETVLALFERLDAR